MEIEHIGYPAEVFYVVALIGVALILYRPRWAFFFIILGLAMRHHSMAVHTRTPLLGEYLNLNDLFLWIGVGAMIREVWSSRLYIPQILLAILGILLVGDFQVLFQYGFNHLTIRTLWASWIFALMFVVAVNMVRDLRDARLFVWALFLGSVGAALHHLVFVHNETLAAIGLLTENDIRSVHFMYSGGLFLGVGALFIDIRRILQKNYLYILWIVGLSLVGISYVLSFTRTVWLGAPLAGIGLFLATYRAQKQVAAKIGYAIPIIILTIVLFKLTSQFFLPGVEVANMLDERADFVRYEDSFEEAYETRQIGVDTELKLWLDGSIIWGVGSSYDPKIEEESIANVSYQGALNHVAYSSYLAHFGLIGLLVYGILLPVLTIQIARRYYFRHMYDYGGIVAATAMVLAFFNLVTLASGFHYLVPSVHVQGLIYGAIWGLAGDYKVNQARSWANII
jgi:hypothetical protein